MRVKALLMIAAVTLGTAVAGTGTATAAPRVDPFCNTTGLVAASNGWSVDAPQVRTRTGGRYQSCYLKYGDRSELTVGELQRTISYCYGIRLDTTGHFDGATLSAVKRVQRLHGLAADGVYGPQTFKAMRWRLTKYVGEGDPLRSERCYQPFVKRSFPAAPASGSYSPYCAWELARHAGGGWWTSLPGTLTRDERVSFACYLKSGDRGNGVYWLQRGLRDCYRASLPADGVYGPRTKATIERVQKLHGIRVDGVYGPATMKAMFWRFSTSQTQSERCYSPF